MGDIEYLEAHATATKLGDATELNTVIELLGGQFPIGKRIRFPRPWRFREGGVIVHSPISRSVLCK